MSKFSSHCMMSGIMCSIVWRATSLPSTLSTPVPPRPMPLTLLKASVPRPRPSYLKSNSTVCLPGDSASGPFPPDALEIHEIVQEHGLSFEHVEPIAAEASTLGYYHAFRARLRDIHFGFEAE